MNVVDNSAGMAHVKEKKMLLKGAKTFHLRSDKGCIFLESVIFLEMFQDKRCIIFLGKSDIFH